MRLTGFFLLGCLALTGIASGQATSDPASAGPAEDPEFDSLLKKSHSGARAGSEGATVLAVPPHDIFEDAEFIKQLPTDVQEAYHAALIAHYEQDTWALKQRQRIFEWQYYAGIVVFVVSISVVAIGLWMSWLQFSAFYRQSLTAPRQLEMTATQVAAAGKAKGAAPEPVQPILNQIEVSATGAKVSTPIVGIIILTLSLAFFYLYLKFVFPIE
ncbi:MAG: hypothetical protein HY290_10220 [Planctomycetia bacterium]|nr:hypothetical protein [Planctomycetia bacterium]